MHFLGIQPDEEKPSVISQLVKAVRNLPDDERKTFFRNCLINGLQKTNKKSFC